MDIDHFQTERPQPPHISLISAPNCHGMQELPSAPSERTKVIEMLRGLQPNIKTPLSIHLSYGLAYTLGSALGHKPPSSEICLAAFLLPNKAGLTAGARAWSKHFHRSQPSTNAQAAETGWWGHPSGPVSVINEKAVVLFHRVMDSATWRNLHWLPQQVLVYEVRVLEGYGMRWSQDQKTCEDGKYRPWIFRGYVEPMMENGHESGWRH